jgi:RNA polymerase sigma-70 factor (ECF subfamily)
MQWITTTQILDELKISNENPAWDRFCDHFRQVVVSFARQLGLSAVDSEDAAQEVMLTFVKAFREGKYNKEKGRLSNWLFGIAKRVILNLRGHKPLEHLVADKTTGTSFWDLIKDDYSLTQNWENQWRQMVLIRCLEQVQQQFEPKVYRAFDLYALSNVPVAEVAQQLKISSNAVYIAKSRVLSKLRQLERQFEDQEEEQ